LLLFVALVSVCCVVVVLFWFLVSGFWFLVSGFWFLVSGFWFLAGKGFAVTKNHSYHEHSIGVREWKLPFRQQNVQNQN
jgi:hypothetical protein